jgi:dipeptidyl aminopeptidase/acylaminoacyl peptidase
VESDKIGKCDAEQFFDLLLDFGVEWIVKEVEANLATNESDYDFSPAPIIFTNDDNALVTGVRPSGDKSNAQFRMSVIPLNGEAVKPIEIPSGITFSGLLRKEGGAKLWQPQPDALVMSGRENSTGNNVFVKLSLKADSPQILWKGAKSPFIIGASEDGQLIGIYGDVNTPADLYRVSSDFSQKERITQVEPRLEGVTFGPVETFTAEAPRYEGGKEVTSAIVLPPGAKRGDKLPTVVVVYPRSMGMPGAATQSFGGGDAAGVPASIYTTNGYAVLFTQAPLRKVGEPGNIIPDILAVIEPQVRRAVELGYTDEKRIAVTGHSFGGYSTAALLSATNLFKAGIANAGSYDLAFIDYFMGADGGYFSEPGKTQAYWNMRGNLWEDQKSYIDASPFFRADKINAPLLIIHGIGDKVCSIEDARLMFNALRRLGKTAQLAEYADEGHFYSDWSLTNRSDVSRRAVEFLNKHIGTSNRVKK